MNTLNSITDGQTITIFIVRWIIVTWWDWISHCMSVAVDAVRCCLSLKTYKKEVQFSRIVLGYVLRSCMHSLMIEINYPNRTNEREFKQEFETLIYAANIFVGCWVCRSKYREVDVFAWSKFKVVSFHGCQFCSRLKFNSKIKWPTETILLVRF